MPSARAIDLWENVSRIARSQFRLESQLLDRNTVLARKVTVVKFAFTTDPRFLAGAGPPSRAAATARQTSRDT